MATHSSILGWGIPWTEEPGRLQSMGSPRVGHNQSDLTHTHTHTHTQGIQYSEMITTIRLINIFISSHSYPCFFLFFSFSPKILLTRALTIVFHTFCHFSEAVYSLCHVQHFCDPPGSCVHGIFQARIVEWVAISFSRFLFLYIYSHQVLVESCRIFSDSI